MELCNNWMPRKQTSCALKSGHRGACSSVSAEDRKAYHQAYYQADRDGKLEKQREWRAENRFDHRAYNRDYQKRNRTRITAQKHGLTLEQFNELWESQNGKCAVCEVPFIELTEAPHIDHDHNCCDSHWSCGKCVRGLLCPPCNKGLGFLENNIIGAVNYLAEKKINKESVNE